VLTHSHYGSDNFSFQNNGIKSAHVGKQCFFLEKQWVFFGKQYLFFVFFKAMFFDTSLRVICFDYKVYAFDLNKKLFMFYINFLFITQSLI